MNKNTKWIVGGSIIVLAIVAMMFLNIQQNTVYFYTPGEAVAKASELSTREIRVGALVKAGTVEKNPDTLDLSFILTDADATEINVSYRGAPPDMFKEGQGVVVEGKISQDGQAMTAHNLFVKHSEEYKKPDDHSKMDAEYLKKSMFKNEGKY